MTRSLQTGQVVIITGGASGLGLALAKRLVADDVRVVLLDRDAGKLAAAAAALRLEKSGSFLVDVTDPAEVRRVVAAVLAELGRIDALVNCAGIAGVTNRRSHEVDLADFDRVIALNLRGSLITAQCVLPHMLARNYGRILHVASIAGKEGNAGMLAYSASKAAVIAMAKVQGKEYAETGVTINSIAPAVIQTELVAQLPPEQVTYMTEKIPMRRCGTLEEFASMAAFIISPENSFTTGFTFDLSGGRAVY